jgi:hypothetical protein
VQRFSGLKCMKRQSVMFNGDCKSDYACHKEEKLCLWPLLDHGFQEDNSLEGIHVKGQTSIMASKRSSLYRREALWKEYMSTTSIRIGRYGSNIPIEEITMSTTGSKSSEVEFI